MKPCHRQCLRCTVAGIWKGQGSLWRASCQWKSADSAVIAAARVVRLEAQSGPLCTASWYTRLLHGSGAAPAGWEGVGWGRKGLVGHDVRAGDALTMQEKFGPWSLAIATACTRHGCTGTHARMCVRVLVCMCLRVRVCVCICVRACVPVCCECVCARACLCVVPVCACMHACMCARVRLLPLMIWAGSEAPRISMHATVIPVLISRPLPAHGACCQGCRLHAFALGICVLAVQRTWTGHPAAALWQTA